MTESDYGATYEHCKIFLLEEVPFGHNCHFTQLIIIMLNTKKKKNSTDCSIQLTLTIFVRSMTVSQI